MPRVVHFEIGADNPDRAVKFYSEIFGWNFQRFDGPEDYWLVRTGDGGQPGIDGGLFKRPGPGQVVNTVDVASVDKYVARITKSGGKLVMPKMAVPGIGWMAYCEDTEGNPFGIIERDEHAG